MPDHEIEIIDATARSPRHRSPNYPAISLPAAIERVAKLYQADKRAGSPLDAALRHMGFSGKHGKSMMVISALRKYGLVEESNGRLIPTQRAVEILVLSKDDPRRKAALRDGALAPDINRELFDQYPDGLPSPETLQSELVAYKGFNPNAVEGFIRDLFETLNFASLLPSDELTSELDDMETGQSPPTTEMQTVSTEITSRPAPTVQHQSTPPRGKAYTFALSPEATAELRIDGSLTPEDLEVLRDYIDITIRALGRTAKPKSEIIAPAAGESN